MLAGSWQHLLVSVSPRTRHAQLWVNGAQALSTEPAPAGTQPLEDPITLVLGWPDILSSTQHAAGASKDTSNTTWHIAAAEVAAWSGPQPDNEQAAALYAAGPCASATSSHLLPPQASLLSAWSLSAAAAAAGDGDGASCTPRLAPSLPTQVTAAGVAVEDMAGHSAGGGCLISHPSALLRLVGGGGAPASCPTIPQGAAPAAAAHAAAAAVPQLQQEGEGEGGHERLQRYGRALLEGSACQHDGMFVTLLVLLLVSLAVVVVLALQVSITDRARMFAATVTCDLCLA